MNFTIKLGKDRHYQFNRERTQCFCSVVLVLASTTASIFAIGANDLMYAIWNARRATAESAIERREFQLAQPTVFPNGSAGPSSFLLFPGTVASIAVDIIYLVAAGLLLSCGTLAGCTCAYVPSERYPDADESARVARNRTDLARYWPIGVVALPFALLLLHLCGNLHYQFYCAVGALPAENCFWMFDYRSLLSGPAGAAAIAIAAGIAFVIVNVIYQIVSCRMFFDRVTPASA